MLESTELTVPVRVFPGLAGHAQPVCFGVPVVKGIMWIAPAEAILESSHGERSIAQVEPLARWSDDSIQWLRADAVITPTGKEDVAWRLKFDLDKSAGREAGAKAPLERAFAACGPVKIAPFGVGRRYHGTDVVTLGSEHWRIVDRRGRIHSPRFKCGPIFGAWGPVRQSWNEAGHFPRIKGLGVYVQWTIYGEPGLLRCDVMLHNSRRARHRGGLWDLGDAGSILLKDFSFRWPLKPGTCEYLTARIEPGLPQVTATRRFEVFQASSGGENWQSRVHVNRHGEVPCPFRGYRFGVDEHQGTGLRASPHVTAQGDAYCVTLAAPEFWQQFPKVLQADAKEMRLGLFPAEFGDFFELQGGERKRHTFWMQFVAAGAEVDDLGWVFHPTIALPAARALVAAGVNPEIRPRPSQALDNLDHVLSEALDGPRSIVVNREQVDEYGWRNFGDMVADHEAAFYKGQAQFVSHYNNQFDVLLGLLMQSLRTNDRRWFRFADELARHVMDIDVYHTCEDRAAYNGGLFWFTDHYHTAHESTHRTYSRKNVPASGVYGGGPGAEHNATTGLLLYHLLTGCPYARSTVIELTDWIVDMEDGRKSMLSILDDGPTGLAAANRTKPSRGGANSINALVDAWMLTKEAKYLNLCEDLIRRCIHPSDDVDKWDLLDVEGNWSYTMFLTSLAKYAAAKEEAGQLDDCYQLATESIVHYAQWMLKHERPYFDQADKLEYPTETWAAQEFRKANVFRRAARFAAPDLARALREKGDEFGIRAWEDLLSFPDSRAAIRPLALMMTEGLADCVFRHEREAPLPRRPARPPIADRERFIPQKRRVRAMLRRPFGIATLVMRVLNPRRWRRRS